MKSKTLTESAIKDFHSIEFERLSAVGEFAKGWTDKLPANVSFVSALNLFRHHIDPREIECASREILKRDCWSSQLSVDVPENKYRQVKGFIAYHDKIFFASFEKKRQRETRPTAQNNTVEIALETVFSRLTTLKKIKDVDDDYIFKLTPRAYTKAKIMLMDVFKRMRKRFPIPRIVADGEGGVLAAWQKGESRVRLRFRAKGDQQDYIYYQSSDDYDIEAASTTNLASRLDWLLKT